MFIRTEALYISLEKEWNKNMWDIRELQWICSAINNSNKMLDSNNFKDDPYAYIFYVKNCFYLENINF